MSLQPAERRDFIRDMISDDLASGKHQAPVTRFPPEPNGYLHIGHAKSICLNFGIAQEFPGARCHLRFDDTNPSKEDQEYVDSIQEDIRWLGFDWGDNLFFASNMFDFFYECAVSLIRKGLAYVDEQTVEEIRAQRGNVNVPGQESPYRNRSVEENLARFQAMKNGEIPEGRAILRARIDMASSNMNMRDPVLYRIMFAEHHNTGSSWCIYPMYDFAHPLEDAYEHITHSLCTLEFENHRPLYDWVIENCPVPARPRQTEFARLNLTYTVMSKRKLLELVRNGFVSGWDDPRMPTICGIRRRGYTPESIRNFAEKVGVAKRDNLIDLSLLEWCLREDLNKRSNRYMVVTDPVKLVITNWNDGECSAATEVETGRTEYCTAPKNPEDPEAGQRTILFGRELYIERADFMEEPPKKFFRLRPGGEVRLKYSYIVKCEEVVKDAEGNITEIRCTYDPTTKPGSGTWRSVKGTIHWVNATQCEKVRLRLYDRLFTEADMSGIPEGKDYKAYLNPDSLKEVDALAEPGLLEDASGIAVQFERNGYYIKDKDSTPELPVFNRATGLKSSF